MRAVTPAGDEYTKGFQQHAAKGYNTAVVLGRDGEFVGYYRKAWPCCPDQDGNSMDDGYPSREMVKTFDLDFGRLGIQVQSGSRHFHSITPMQNQKASCKGWLYQSLSMRYDDVSKLVSAAICFADLLRPQFPGHVSSNVRCRRGHCRMAVSLRRRDSAARLRDAVPLLHSPGRLG